MFTSPAFSLAPKGVAPQNGSALADYQVSILEPHSDHAPLDVTHLVECVRAVVLVPSS